MPEADFDSSKSLYIQPLERINKTGKKFIFFLKIIDKIRNVSDTGFTNRAMNAIGQVKSMISIYFRRLNPYWPIFEVGKCYLRICFS